MNNELPKGKEYILTPDQLVAARKVEDLLSRQDAHLIDAGGSEIPPPLSEPTVQSGEELRRDRDIEERLSTTHSPWLDN